MSHRDAYPFHRQPKTQGNDYYAHFAAAKDRRALPTEATQRYKVAALVSYTEYRATRRA